MSQATTLTASERIEILDVLRGFALFGIMSVNVFVFAHPVNWFDVSWQEIGPFEYGFELLKLVFVQGKFYSLFAFLFGLGFAMQLASAEQRGESFVLRFTVRMIILFLIALIHFALIWNGDILKNYALAGLALLILYLLKQPLDNVYKRFTGRDKMPRWLIIVAACSVLSGPHVIKGSKAYLEAQTIKKYEAGHTLTENGQQFIDDWKKAKLPETIEEKAAKKASQHNMFATQSYSDVLAYRIDLLPEKLWQPSFNILVLGLFLFGAYFGRQNLINQADKNRGLFKRIAIGGFIIGMIFNGLFVWAMINMPPQVDTFWSFAINLGKSGAGLCFALMYIAIISLLMLGSAKRFLRWLAPVGRMTLTHYLLQSLVGTWVFYGHGLGLMTDISVISQLGFIIILFSAQVAFSQWWIIRYRYGPLEWLWRSLTYWQPQPMRRDRSAASPLRV